MPHEFAVKVSLATTQKHAKGGQFALHVMALPGNPDDGHTLKDVIPDMEKLISNDINAILAATDYNFCLLLNWVKDFLRLCWLVLFALRTTAQT